MSIYEVLGVVLGIGDLVVKYWKFLSFWCFRFISRICSCWVVSVIEKNRVG